MSYITHSDKIPDIVMHLIDLIEGLHKRRHSHNIFVIGDIILDKYIWGSVKRISPEAPIQVLNVENEEYRAGGAANVARNIASLGVNVVCAGSIGNDNSGKEVISLLREEGINISGIVRDKNKPTSVKTRLIAHSQQMVRVDRESTAYIDKKIESALIGSSKRFSKVCSSVIISDYNKGTLTKDLCESIISYFRSMGKPIIVGPKNSDFMKYRGADGAVLNRGELTSVTGKSSLTEGAKRLMKALSLKFLIVTQGEKGMLLYSQNGKPLELPAVAREVYDVTGAGDTVLAILSLFYTAGNSIEDAVQIANAAAGIVVGKVGAAVVTKGELVNHLSYGTHAVHSKILKCSVLPSVIRQERSQGRKVVFTNGCFDLLHTGHLRTIQFAKSRGDVLIVGLNSDKSVRAIKGNGRPVLSAKERAELLAALEAVDYVIIFDEDTPLNLIKKIKPDVLVKGSDWTGDVVGQRFVESYGGRVEFVPLLKGVSTTGIIERVRKELW